MAREQAAVGYTWGDYIDELVAQAGSLTALAERIAATRSSSADHGAPREPRLASASANVDRATPKRPAERE